MTEAQWTQGTFLPNMLWALQARNPSPRKARLWNVAVCLRWREHVPKPLLAVLADAERLADGERTPEDERSLGDRVEEVIQQLERLHPNWEHPTLAARRQRMAAGAIATVFLPTELFGVGGYITEIERDEAAQKCRLLREVFGNPFRPVAFDGKWRTEDAIGVASKMYEERDFAAMPILADALKAAGCDEEAVLTHCREPGVHVRGCWVVDLVLGRR